MKKVLIALLLILFAVPAKATNIGDILATAFIIKEVKEEFTKKGEIEIKEIYVERADDYVRAQKIRAQMNVAIKKRQIQNCIERFECDKIDFKR